MTNETFRKAESLANEIIGIKKKISNREETLYAIEHKTNYIDNFIVNVTLNYNEKDGRKNVSRKDIIEISPETIKKELRQQIFDLKNLLFVKQSNFKSL